MIKPEPKTVKVSVSETWDLGLGEARKKQLKAHGIKVRTYTSDGVVWISYNVGFTPLPYDGLVPESVKACKRCDTRGCSGRGWRCWSGLKEKMQARGWVEVQVACGGHQAKHNLELLGERQALTRRIRDVLGPWADVRIERFRARDVPRVFMPVGIAALFLGKGMASRDDEGDILDEAKFEVRLTGGAFKDILAAMKLDSEFRGACEALVSAGGNLASMAGQAKLILVKARANLDEADAFLKTHIRPGGFDKERS